MKIPNLIQLNPKNELTKFEFYKQKRDAIVEVEHKIRRARNVNNKQAYKDYLGLLKQEKFENIMVEVNYLESWDDL